MDKMAHAILFGVAVGDALGVPVEFDSRASLEISPLTDMEGYGTHNQPPGTWSDDSSLTFCLAESLLKGYDLQHMGQTFCDWYFEKKWTPHGEVFDIGGTTLKAIRRIKKGDLPAELAGGTGEYENGNGSLMRILPLLAWTRNKAIAERFEAAQLVSSITHAHFRSYMSCFIYLELALELLTEPDLLTAHRNTIQKVNEFFSTQSPNPEEWNHFNRVLDPELGQVPMKDIHGSGYVIHSLEASIWCMLNSQNYQEAVLKAINLGEDTDTTGAITGGLAGLYYGLEGIPARWIAQIVRKDDIMELSDQFQGLFEN